MIGMVGHHIQIDRIIKSQTIDKENKLAFLPIDISSLLSVIDCRDLLYVWVYNRHTVVYTDFLYQEMIQHLINLGKERNNVSLEIDREDYFSCSAISKKYISDDDIRVLLNNEYIYRESECSKRVLPQLLERKFLKPLWKSIYGFKSYLNNNNEFDEKAK